MKGSYIAMVGYPKYKVGDIVKFKIDDEVKEGAVYIVDKYGTFENCMDVSYDIMVQKENTLYKHISEIGIIDKVHDN
jgi:ribosomal protein L21E